MKVSITRFVTNTLQYGITKRIEEKEELEKGYYKYNKLLTYILKCL